MSILEALSEILKKKKIHHELQDNSIIIYSDKNIPNCNFYVLSMGKSLLKVRVSQKEIQDEIKYEIKINVISIERDKEEILANRIFDWLKDSGYILSKDLIINT